jgi:ribosomal-protein-alanine N-acetyltransferase
VRIQGERIVLREFEERDLDASMAVVGDPDVTTSLSFDTRTREEQAERLAADIARAQAEPRPDYYLAIADRQTDELIGFIRIGLGGHRSGELGYALRKDRWRHGYTSEAAQLMLIFGFGELCLHRVQAACGPDNLGSQAMLRRLSFEYEGRMRDHVFTNGAWRDSLLYSLLERTS